MAEGFLRSYGPELDVYSAGTMAEGKVNPFAVKAMGEEGIDISSQTSDSIDKYVDEAFDHVVTVCDGAKESCPVFTGDVKNRLHIGFDDPAVAKGSEAEVMPVYRRVRDEIKIEFLNFYNNLQSS
jgi:arsenate reductase